MSSQTARYQDINQMINGLHPSFVNLRFAAKEIEQEIEVDQRKMRPIEALLDMAKSQTRANRHHVDVVYPSPTN